jgi:hypothetical protein
MENQGKTKQQVKDSENSASIAIVGLIVTALSIILVELFF